MKTLPYFKWFPADAEMDEAYSLLTNEELGLFHRCLNRSWMNQGLPAAPEDIARLVHCDWATFKRLWVRIGPMFVIRDTRTINPRQERERDQAIEKGEKMKRPGNTNAKKEGTQNNAEETQAKRAGNAIANNPRNSASLRASDSGSVSDSSSPKKLPETISPNFDSWWARWSRDRGTNHQKDALQAWISVVSLELEQACFECTESYLRSRDDHSTGYNPETFLFDQAREGFQARWPPAPSKMRKPTVPIRATAPEHSDEEKIAAWQLGLYENAEPPEILMEFAKQLKKRGVSTARADIEKAVRQRTGKQATA